MDTSPSLLPTRARSLQRRRRQLLLLALAVHAAMMTFLAFDGLDRGVGAGDQDAFDPDVYVFALPFGVLAALALVATLLPGRAPRVCALVLGALGVALALLLVPAYGLGLLLLPGAAVALWAGFPAD